MKGSEAKLLGFMEGANNRYVIPVYQIKYDLKSKAVRKMLFFTAFLLMRQNFCLFFPCRIDIFRASRAL